MKIVHIGLGTGPPLLYEYGGAIQRRILELARAQAARGHSVVAYSNGTEYGLVNYEGVDIQFVPVGGPQLTAGLEFQTRVVRHLESATEPVPDVLHFHSNPEGAWFSRKIPSMTVLTFDNVYFRGFVGATLRPVYKRLLGRFDLLLACSDYCREAFVDHWRLPQERVRVVPNGVNTHQFRPDPESGAMLRSALGLQHPIVLYVGRVCEQKGVDTLLAAHRRLQEDRQIELVIAGPIETFGNDRKMPLRWERALTADGVRYLGSVGEFQLSSLYNMADVFVMPTRELEMFGMAAVEAQACGKPVIASAHGGLRETVPPGCGLSFPVGDSEMLAERIADLLDSEDKRSSLGHCALEHSREYEWSSVAEDLEGEYLTGIGARTNTAQVTSVVAAVRL